MHREEPVLVPCCVGIERDTRRRETLAVALDDPALDRFPQRDRDRVAHHVGDVAHPGCLADHRPVEEAGAVTANVDEEVPDVRVAVHQRARALAKQLHDVVRACQEDARDRVEVLVHLVAEHVDRSWDERSAAADAHTAFCDPLEVAARREALRLPERRVQDRELLDDVARPSLDVGVVGTGEPAPARDEILEHHDVLVTVGLGEPDSRYAHGDLAREVAVEARLRDAHARPIDERTLLLAERRKLHEHARRNPGLAAGARRVHVRWYPSCDRAPSRP